MATFLRNQWYAAATSQELAEAPLARTICNEPLVLFRGQDAEPAALTDRCPHRKAPLSSGEVIGGDIQCGYHGIRFARDGTCTHVPGGAPIGRNFRARSFPVREIHGLIFVWLGEPALANSALIPSWGLDDASVSKVYKDMTDLAFAEDARMVEQQQALIDSDDAGTPLVSLAFDRAALAARRIIKRKLEEEQQATILKEPAERVSIDGAGATG